MKKIVSLVLLVAMLMTSIVAMAEGEKSDFDLNVFYDQMRLDNSGYKQYSFTPLPCQPCSSILPILLVFFLEKYNFGGRKQKSPPPEMGGGETM